MGVYSGESAMITEDTFDRCDEKRRASDLAVDGRNLIELLFAFKPSCKPRPWKSVTATYSNTTLTRHNTRRIGANLHNRRRLPIDDRRKHRMAVSDWAEGGSTAEQLTAGLH